MEMTRASKPQRRVVVTGVGAVTPAGLTAQESWQSVLEQKSGISSISQFDASDYPVQIAGEVTGFDPSAFVSPKEQRKMDRFIQLSLAATDMAIKESGLDITDDLAPRTGAIIGVGIGGLPQIETQHQKLLNRGPEKVSPFFIPMVITNLASGHISMKYNAKNVNYCISSACSSGSHAIGEATQYIRDGRADIMIAGGAEASVCAMSIAGFSAMRALSRNNDSPSTASCPFDKNRNGFVLSEGAATLILEDLEHALKRKATIYAEVTGYGVSSDSYHISSPPEDGAGATAAMTTALQDAGLKAQDISYVNAHGTSTPVGDAIECKAIKNIFGDHPVAVSSTKGVTGHLLGAAGAIESLFSIMAIKEQTAPPTANLKEIDDNCQAHHIVGKPLKGNFNHVINNSFGFGGTNSSLIFSKI